MAKKSAKIIEIREMMGETGLIIIEQIGIAPLIALQKELEGIEAKWFEPYGEHLLSDIVMITLPAVMAWTNERGGTAEFARIKGAWLRRFLIVPQRISSRDTIQEVMPMIDGGILYRLCIQFLIRRLDILAARERRIIGNPEGREAPKVLAIDGKMNRGSKRNKTDRDGVGAMHTVSGPFPSPANPRQQEWKGVN